MKAWSYLAALATALLLWTMPPAGAQGLQPVPPLAARVTDNAGMLDAKQKAALEGVLADYEAKTGSQIAVLLVKSTEPEAIEQYSIRVTDAWKLGRKGVDDGVLLMVAKDNPSSLRRLRIEAGRGVQGVLTDAQSKRILQDVIAPHFKQNDYYGGLVAGVGSIATLLNQEQFPAAAQQKAPATVEAGGMTFWLPLLFFGFLVVLTLFRSRGGPTRLQRGSNWSSGATGVVLGSILSQALNNRGGGGFGGGGFGGGSSGGGGFGGGGGGFDGGGASGDW
ncbi:MULTISPECIES: YgcG family protein [unclassified Janthinobacterium]|uniref:TPM domain-containing protein n=1 Tax=unclassified Janthinobacterium TaxID=2610881 RepID=UPI0027138610|nr:MULTISPECIES: TPM domain-containing protein [unclassified Janthinobacterium]MDO8069133.1 TPM domain-containing protein [Janthinobacterium sp. SUN206]MDO8074157.1 TPM domain-containing protein [Janthinobacterium sp. SUN176]